MQEYQEKRGVQMRHMWGMTELAPIGSVAGLKVSPHCASPFDGLGGTGFWTCAFFTFPAAEPLAPKALLGLNVLLTLWQEPL